MKILLENVRSFAGTHIVPLARLTVLVGENSTGKSTFMGMVAAALSAPFPAPRVIFAIPPFDFGGYETIATYKGGRFGRSHSFSIGYSDEAALSVGGVVDQGQKPGKQPVSYRATYSDRRGQPALSRYVVQHGDDKLELSIEGKKANGKITLAIGTSSSSFDFSGGLEVDRFTDSAIGLFNLVAQNVLNSELMAASTNQERSSIFNRVYNLVQGKSLFRETAIPIAPVRTRPKRTYDELSDDFQPEGEHIPLKLSRWYVDRSDEEKRRLWSLLNEFGVNAGLFEKVDVKRLGQRETSPFQIRVKTGGPLVNLADVGYGVSQVLPIVVESLLAESGTMLLLQQPEVHLHPRAQAALGSLLGMLVKTQGKRFLVETHSDYLLDRLRIEIAAGRLDAADVSILYFERRTQKTTVHVLGLDQAGNLTNIPKTFRKFFLDEEARLLRRGE